MHNQKCEKTKKWSIVFFISLIIFLIAISVLFYHLFFKNKSNDESGVISFPEVSSVEPVKNPINFAALKSENDDIYAWITIPNTQVDYPIVQSASDDSFYLDHNSNQKYDVNGSIYTERKNNKDFSDPNTLIYGHNMKNGSMFASLHKFEDPEFFEQNKYIYIYTENSMLTYEIYAAYRYDNRHILNSFDFSDKEVFKNYIETTKNPTSLTRNIRNETSITENDKIITLSTCLGINTQRYLVQGVLINNVPTK